MAVANSREALLRERLSGVCWKLTAVGIGLAAAGLLAAAFGMGMGPFAKALWHGAFGSPGRLIATIAKMTPLVLAGLAVAVPLKGRLFNIGAEGQLYAGALASVSVALALGALPRVVLVPLTLMAGTAAGAAYGGVAGRLKARYGVHEVISTIMLNFVALYMTSWLVNIGPLASPDGVGRTPLIPEGARLPAIAESGAYSLSAGIIIALAGAGAAWWLVSVSVTGFRMRAAGDNPVAAGRKGISAKRMIMTAMAAGGAFAGLAGAAEATGVHYSVSASFSPGYGFDGIAVALLAGANPLGVVPAAALFAALRAAGPMLQLDAGISAQMIYVIEAIVVIAAAVPAAPRILARLRPRSKAAIEAEAVPDEL